MEHYHFNKQTINMDHAEEVGIVLSLDFPSIKQEVDLTLSKLNPTSKLFFI